MGDEEFFNTNGDTSRESSGNYLGIKPINTAIGLGLNRRVQLIVSGRELKKETIAM